MSERNILILLNDISKCINKIVIRNLVEVIGEAVSLMEKIAGLRGKGLWS